MTTTVSLRTFARRWAPPLAAFGLLLGFAGAGPVRPARAQVDPIQPVPTPTCEARCEAEARAVRQACLDLGGTPEQCELRFRDTFERCMQACQPTPATCEERCGLLGRQVYEACIAAGRGPDVCEAEAAAARRDCIRRECEPTRTPTPRLNDVTPTPTPATNDPTRTPTFTPRPEEPRATLTPSNVDPTRTPTAATCRGRCEQLGREAYERCIAGGGGPDACERQAAEVREGCIRRECEPTRTATPGSNIGTPETCEGRCEARRRDVLAACLAAGRGPDVCEREANSARELCLRECEPTRTPTPATGATPATCEGRCAAVGRETYERCIASGRGADACEAEATAARNRCLNACGPDRTATPADRPPEATPVGCEARCGDRARQAYEACIAAGRGPDVCEAEAANVRASCMRECPGQIVATPGPVNTACGDRCEGLARDIRSRCLEGGGGEDRCHAEAEAARRACQASCEPSNVRPPETTCAEKCAALGRGIYERCRAEGGSEAGCLEKAAIAERECATSCANADQPTDCAGRCAARGREIELLCLSKGEDPSVCARARTAAEASCRLACAPSSASPFCQTACRSLANVAYRRCIRAGGSFADCRAKRDQELAACIDRCLRDQPLRGTPERP